MTEPALIPGLTLRTEREGDRRAVEEITREAFYNRYAPGCTEHWVVHLLRNDPGFAPWHSVVAEYAGEIIGHALLSPATIHTPDGLRVPALCMGPLTVLPAAQLRGVGSALLREAVARADSHNAIAVFLTGNPRYFHRFGFESAFKYKVFYPGAPEGDEAAFFMAKPLYRGSLHGCEGVFRVSPLFEAEEGPEFLEYDAAFPVRKKLKLPGQLR